MSVRFQDNVLLWWFKVNELRQLLCQEQPDNILIHGGPANPLTLFTIYAARKACSKAKILNFTWHNLKYRPSSPKTIIARLIQSYTFPRLDAILAGAKEGVGVFNSEGYKGKLVWMPLVTVDEVRWRPGRDQARREELGMHGFCIGFSGRIEHEKGVDLLIRALKNLPGHCTAYLIGAGTAVSDLRELVKNLGLVDRVTFARSKRPEELPGIYPHMDALVLPSRTTAAWVEQFGMVLIEAMSCGLPVIGSSSGSIPDVVGPGGLVFSEGSVDELTSRLRKLLDQDFYESQVDVSRARAQMFSPEATANRLIALGEDLV